MNEVVKYAFDKHLEAFEMLGTNQAWLNIWPNRLHEYHNFRLYPITPLTIFSHGLELANFANKKIRTYVAKRQKSHSAAAAQNAATSQ
jgi:hypothetical protein